MSKMQARNWWGTAWVEKMERLAEPSRFAAGASCERTGRVAATEFDGRTITAKVQASKEPGYTVRISFDPFSEEEWELLLTDLRVRDEYAASLSKGDLPLETQTAFSKAGLRFMPERYTDLHLECACPDWLKPCKHLVAAWMNFGRSFDRDPFLLFELRGLRRHEFLARLQDAPREAVAETPAGMDEFAETAFPVVPQALPSDPAVFWSAPELPPLSAKEPSDWILPDEDVFEKLRHWRGIDPQLRQVYDAVYELASRMVS